jgi:hypothetical protein
MNFVLFAGPEAAREQSDCALSTLPGEQRQEVTFI